MESLALQSTGMRGRRLGWRAERCADPQSCELHLCISDPQGSYWHPADPLAFARWRIRGDVDAMPAHVVVRVERRLGSNPTRHDAERPRRGRYGRGAGRHVVGPSEALLHEDAERVRVVVAERLPLHVAG